MSHVPFGWTGLRCSVAAWSPVDAQRATTVVGVLQWYSVGGFREQHVGHAAALSAHARRRPGRLTRWRTKARTCRIHYVQSCTSDDSFLKYNHVLNVSLCRCRRGTSGAIHRQAHNTVSARSNSSRTQEQPAHQPSVVVQPADRHEATLVLGLDSSDVCCCCRVTPSMTVFVIKMSVVLKI